MDKETAFRTVKVAVESCRGTWQQHVALQAALGVLAEKAGIDAPGSEA
jgi:hypothetical protein